MKKNGADIICPSCGKTRYFPASHIRYGRTHCSMACRNNDPEFLAMFRRNSNTKQLNATQKGPHHPRWRGGRFVTPLGYVAVYVPRHPRASIAGQYVFEHRLVMEKYLNRELNPGEVVHHINGEKTDNRIENLVLMSKHEHDMHHGCVRRCRAQTRSLK